MGQKRTPGLVNRNGVWHIDKLYRGHRICESTGTGELAKAQEHLTRKLEEARQAAVFGIRPARTFREAATKYLNENQHKRSLRDDAVHLKQLDPYIGALPLASVHMGTLGAFIAERRKQGVKTRTINMALQVVRHILNVAASEWLDEYNLTWLHAPPKIKLFRIEDARDPHPLSWDEQDRLFRELPEHLACMALFKVNTGCREQEVCHLRWEWERRVPELNASVFVIPAAHVKNRAKRVVVLNEAAQAVIEARRGRHPECVFSFRGRPIAKMNNSAWQDARKRAGLPQVRVHDLKHTFGRRLRAAGVSFEDRQDLLGHKSARITDHYSAAEIGNLVKAANKACRQGSRKSPADDLGDSGTIREVAVSY